MLDVQDLHASYGQTPVLRRVSLEVRAGEVVALLGRNGSGRSTLARALMGLLPWKGQVTWRGQSLGGLPPHTLAHMGLGYVPEHRDIFPGLSVRQNLRLGIKPRQSWLAGTSDRKDPDDWCEEDVYQLFPQLRVRAQTLAGVLSGGEQQMLALGRTLMGNPGLMILDEPTEGLAPQLIEQVRLLIERLRQRSTAVLLIEQKLTLALSLSDRVLVMGQGRIVYAGTPQGLLDQSAVRRTWLEV